MYAYETPLLRHSWAPLPWGNPSRWPGKPWAFAGAGRHFFRSPLRWFRAWEDYHGRLYFVQVNVWKRRLTILVPQRKRKKMFFVSHETANGEQLRGL